MRSYGDPCGIARALDRVGERWALLIVRELLLGPKRFTDLRSGLPNLGADVLSQRLRDLEHSGVLRRGKLPPPAGSRVYELTDRGRELEPVVLALGRWGSSAPFPETDAQLSPDAFAIALKTVFDPATADGLRGVFELQLGDRMFRASISDAGLDIAQGVAPEADTTIDGAPGPLAGVLWHGQPLTDSGVTIRGDRAAAERFLALFRVPASTT